jgi:shikimate 5-dehydrogenase
MNLALIGRGISHSLSPHIYQQLIGPQINYDLLDVDESGKLPNLKELAKKYVAINITSPYKEFYVKDVIIVDPLIRSLGAINTISFTENGFYGTNTDLLALRKILRHYRYNMGIEHMIILGSGVMARLTLLVAKELDFNCQQFARKMGHLLESLDLTAVDPVASPLIVNCCSREFVFQGKLPEESYFLDYNYQFAPHQERLRHLVKDYQDGQELLWQQAREAVHFWRTTNPKLKC